MPVAREAGERGARGMRTSGRGRTHRRGHQQRREALLRIARVDLSTCGDELYRARFVPLRTCSHQSCHAFDLALDGAILGAARGAPVARGARGVVASVSRRRARARHARVLRTVSPAAQHMREHYVRERREREQRGRQNGVRPDEALRLDPLARHEAHAAVRPPVQHELPASTSAHIGHACCKRRLAGRKRQRPRASADAFGVRARAMLPWPPTRHDQAHATRSSGCDTTRADEGARAWDGTHSRSIRRATELSSLSSSSSRSGIHRAALLRVQDAASRPRVPREATH